MKIRLLVRAAIAALLPIVAAAQDVSATKVVGTTGDIVLDASSVTSAGVLLKTKTTAANNITAQISSNGWFQVMDTVPRPLFGVHSSGMFVFFRPNGATAVAESMRVTAAGDVGIGVAEPASRLHVAGALQVDRHLIMPGWVPLVEAHTTGYVKLITPIVHNEWNMFHIAIKGYRYHSGKEPIDIRCTGYAFGMGSLIEESCETNGTGMPVEIGVEQRTGAPAPVVVIRIGRADTVWYFPNFTAEYSGWNVKSAAGFQWVVETASPTLSGNTNNIVASDRNGTLQLGQPGTGAGTTRLTVNGNIAATGTVTGIIHAVYQDIAEWVPATGDVSPGTVVVLNEARNNEVMPSSRPYDTAVAGVVSPQPGVILGHGGPGQAQIATTGRVRVRVDATKRSIRVGDILVTSDKPGMAMVSEPTDFNGRKFHQPGTILGKALEPLASGEGDVLVLLSLQ